MHIYIYIFKAAAPAADPGTKHQEREFSSLQHLFFNIMFQILEHKKSPEPW